MKGSFTRSTRSIIEAPNAFPIVRFNHRDWVVEQLPLVQCSACHVFRFGENRRRRYQSLDITNRWHAIDHIQPHAIQKLMAHLSPPLMSPRHSATCSCVLRVPIALRISRMPRLNGATPGAKVRGIPYWNSTPKNAMAPVKSCANIVVNDRGSTTSRAPQRMRASDV